MYTFYTFCHIVADPLCSHYGPPGVRVSPVCDEFNMPAAIDYTHPKTNFGLSVRNDSICSLLFIVIDLL